MGSYWFTDMGILSAGNYVEVKMNLSANVRIMTDEAFKDYKKKTAHKFIGGYVKFSPYIVQVPTEGRWYVVVDRGGKEGKVSASVTVYPNPKKVREKQIILPEEPST